MYVYDRAFFCSLLSVIILKSLILSFKHETHASRVPARTRTAQDQFACRNRRTRPSRFDSVSNFNRKTLRRCVTQRAYQQNLVKHSVNLMKYFLLRDENYISVTTASQRTLYS